jgi:hypothetical protein
MVGLARLAVPGMPHGHVAELVGRALKAGETRPESETPRELSYASPEFGLDSAFRGLRE